MIKHVFINFGAKLIFQVRQQEPLVLMMHHAHSYPSVSSVCRDQAMWISGEVTTFQNYNLC